MSGVARSSRASPTANPAGGVKKGIVVLSRCRTLVVAVLTVGVALPAGTAEAKRLTLGDRNLRQGMAGRDVRVLQDFLGRVGLKTAVDGQYGPATSRRVKSWERKSSRRVNGRMSRSDQRKLRGQVNAGITVNQPKPEPIAPAAA